MANQATTYKVDIVYDLKGNAGRGVRQLNQDVRQATASMGGLRSMLAYAGGGALFIGAKKAFIDFNSQLEKMKIGLATVSSMNLGVPFAVGQKAADKLFQTFQKMAIQSPATTKDFVDMANMISSGVLQAGLGLKGLESITKGAITASAALGAPAELLALDVTQMLAGTVAIRDRFARQLLHGVGISDHTEFNKKSASERGAIVMKAFSHQSLQDASKAFETSFAGVTSTLKDNLEIALGKVGIPLMKELTGIVSGWNSWIQRNPEKIASMASSLGNGLRDAFSVVKDIAVAVFPIIKDVFGVVKDVLAFVSNHREVLINTVKALLVFKGVSMVGGMAMGAARGVGGIFGGGFGQVKQGFDGLKNGTGSLMTAFGNLGTLLTGAGGVIAGLAKLAGIAYVAGGILFGKSQEDKRREAQAKAEFLVGSKFNEAITLRNQLRERMEKFGIFDRMQKGEKLVGPAQEMAEQFEKVNADLAKTREELIQRGIKSGLVSEQASGTGERKLTLFTPSSANIASTKATNELATALYVLFKEEITTAVKSNTIAGGQLDWTMGQWFGGTRGGMLGFFREKLVGDDPNANIDPYSIPGVPRSEVKVNINKIEVYSDDPDRFVAQAVQSFDEITRNPTQAHSIIRGAF